MKTDKVGSCQNSSTGVRSRYVDTRYHIVVRENVEEGIVKIGFVKSSDNDSDIFTKNTSQEKIRKACNEVSWEC